MTEYLPEGELPCTVAHDFVADSMCRVLGVYESLTWSGRHGCIQRQRLCSGRRHKAEARKLGTNSELMGARRLGAGSEQRWCFYNVHLPYPDLSWIATIQMAGGELDQAVRGAVDEALDSLLLRAPVKC